MSTKTAMNGASAPDVVDVADTIGVRARQLELFVDGHPAPDAAAILGWARAAPTHRGLVEQWLAVRNDGGDR